MVGYLVVLVLSFCSSALSLPSVIDCTRNVTYKGNLTNSVEQFLNIRFGEDTSGENRFAHPKPFHYKSGSVVNATAPGPACPQDKVPSFIGFTPFSNISEISEDCLNLRIARPENTTADARLPVMVWIYGGADELGQAYDDLYDPTSLILGAASKGMPVIYVAMNYRVNIFGFASSPALAAEGSLNSGLLDQRLALEWIQANIAHFGGDPSSVTIFGESAGGTSVGLQMTAYGGKGSLPFHRAILQSGSPSADSGVSGDAVTNSTERIAASTNCRSSSTALTLACLRRLPMPILLKAALQAEELTGQNTFSPVVDEDFIPAPPSILVRTGRFHKNIPVIVGWTRDDGSIFADPATNDTAVIIHEQFPGVNSSSIATLLSLYPISEFTARAATFNVTPEYFQSTGILRDIYFTCPGLFFSYNVALGGSPAYLFELNQTAFGDIFEELGAPYLGVSHLSDIGFVFNFAGFVEDDATTRQLASQVSGSWTSFAETGVPWRMVPVGETLPEWPLAFDNVWGDGSSRFKVQIIGGPDAGTTVFDKIASSEGENSLVRRCEFINSPDFYAQIQT